MGDSVATWERPVHLTRPQRKPPTTASVRLLRCERFGGDDQRVQQRRKRSRGCDDDDCVARNMFVELVAADVTRLFRTPVNGHAVKGAFR